MSLTYPDKFTYMMELAQRCSDNGGPTVLIITTTYYKMFSLINLEKKSQH